MIERDIYRESSTNANLHMCSVDELRNNFISARHSMIPGSDNYHYYYALNIKVKRVENTIFFSWKEKACFFVYQIVVDCVMQANISLSLYACVFSFCSSSVHHITTRVSTLQATAQLCDWFVSEYLS